jgi:sugar phosphate permease
MKKKKKKKKNEKKKKKKKKEKKKKKMIQVLVCNKEVYIANTATFIIVARILVKPVGSSFLTPAPGATCVPCSSPPPCRLLLKLQRVM